MRYWLLVLLALLLLHNVAITYAQTDRHVVGFPNTFLNDLLSNIKLDPKLLNTLNSITSSAVGGGLTDTDIANAMRSDLNSGASDKDVFTFFNILNRLHGFSKSSTYIPPEVLYDLVNSIKD